MIKVEGKARHLNSVDRQEIREKLKDAFADVLAEEGVDIEQVEVNKVSFGVNGKYELKVKSK